MRVDHLKSEYKILTQMIKEIQKFLENAPEGYVKINRRKNDYSYYHMTKDKKEEKEKSKYLKKHDKEEGILLKKLMQKQYYQKLLPVILEEKQALEKFFKTYNPKLKYDVYDRMSETRKQFLTPVFCSPEIITERWEKEEYERNSKYHENLIYETNRGDMVRSKSEIIIADLLYYNKEYCAYRYEAPLYIHEKRMVLHPDFTIMKRSTAELFYWEHFGMMDVESYAEIFVKKMNEYILAGIYPGKQLICTFESKEKPLETKVIRNLINEYFR